MHLFPVVEIEELPIFLQVGKSGHMSVLDVKARGSMVTSDQLTLASRSSSSTSSTMHQFSILQSGPRRPGFE